MTDPLELSSPAPAALEANHVLPRLRASSAMVIDFVVQASFLHRMANLDRRESRVCVNLGTRELPQQSPASNAPRNPSPLVPSNMIVCHSY